MALGMVVERVVGVDTHSGCRVWGVLWINVG